MPNNFRFRRNTFQETLLALEYEPRQGHSADLFSQACVEAYTEADQTHFGYFFTQIFEPDVLREVALLEGIAYESVADLSYRQGTTISHLATMVENASELPLIELVNLASALISISRFEVASRLLNGVTNRVTTAREKFEVAWLEFLISNRCYQGQHSPVAFAKMREAIHAGGIPPGRVLDACTQAVVWHLKRREVGANEFQWWVRLGNSLVKVPDQLEQGTVSSWYRGLAMLPAAKGKPSETRKFMEMARVAAEQTIAQHPCAYKLNTLKTYYESTMKEHMYVTKNFEAAEKAGLALIALDLAWSPSYGELAEVYDHFGQLPQATDLYEQAIAVGPPYFGHHLLQAARCREKLGNNEIALDHYLTLAKIAPQSERILKEGLEVARQVSPASRTHFEHELDQLSNIG